MGCWGYGFFDSDRELDNIAYAIEDPEMRDVADLRIKVRQLRAIVDEQDSVAPGIDDADLLSDVGLFIPRFPALVREYLNAGLLAHLLLRFSPGGPGWKSGSRDPEIMLSKDHMLCLITIGAMDVGATFPSGFLAKLAKRAEDMRIYDDQRAQIRFVCGEYIDGKPLHLLRMGIGKDGNGMEDLPAFEDGTEAASGGNGSRASSPISTSENRLTFETILIPVSILSTSYIHIYPIFRPFSCSFARPPSSQQAAPFRLLTLADPQLEGSSSLPNAGPIFSSALAALRPQPKNDVFDFVSILLASQANTTTSVNAYSPIVAWRSTLSAHLTTSRNVLSAAVTKDIPRLARRYRKQIDLWGNDLYLAHIFRTIYRHTKPTHAVVLGDLLGSQWINDEEFGRRAGRYWDTVFSGMGMSRLAGEYDTSDAIWQDAARTPLPRRQSGDSVDWTKNLINVVGNHDIGYAGDLDKHRTERFERVFGPLSWRVRFVLEGSPAEGILGNFTGARLQERGLEHDPSEADRPSIELVILNSMNLDSHAYNQDMQRETWSFLNRTIADLATRPDTADSRRRAVILLTHIPLHRPAGTCVDAPFFDYFPKENGCGVKEQNHLSRETSARVLELFRNTAGPGHWAGHARAGIILNGHDHEGCDVMHTRQAEAEGDVESSDPSAPSAREGTSATEDDVPTQDVTTEWDSDLISADRESVTEPDTLGHNRSIPGWTTQRSLMNEGVPMGTVREVTVRSMMGDFSGNSGLVSGWFDTDLDRWAFEYRACRFGVQHLWWAVYIVDSITVVLGLSTLGLKMFRTCRSSVKDQG